MKTNNMQSIEFCKVVLSLLESKPAITFRCTRAEVDGDVALKRSRQETRVGSAQLSVVQKGAIPNATEDFFTGSILGKAQALGISSLRSSRKLVFYVASLGRDSCVLVAFSGDGWAICYDLLNPQPGVKGLSHHIIRGNEGGWRRTEHVTS